MRSLLIEIGQWDDDERAPMWCDSNGTIAIGNGEVGLTERNKFFEIDYYHFRDYQNSGEIAIGRVATTMNPADLFTTTLTPIKCDFSIANHPRPNRV